MLKTFSKIPNKCVHVLMFICSHFGCHFGINKQCKIKHDYLMEFILNSSDNLSFYRALVNFFCTKHGETLSDFAINIMLINVSTKPRKTRLIVNLERHQGFQV